MQILNIMLGKGKHLQSLQNNAMYSLKEFGKNTNASAEMLANTLNENLTAYMSTMLYAFKSTPKGTFGERLSSATDSIAAKYPKASVVASFGSSVMGLVGLGLSVYQCYEKKFKVPRKRIRSLICSLGLELGLSH